MVFQYLKERPRTCLEIVAISNIKHQSASARLHELEKAGCVVRSSKRGTSDVYEMVPGKSYKDFVAWRSNKGKSRPSSRAQLLKLCEEAAPQLKAGGASKKEALKRIERAIRTTFGV